jgi:hypothetical protein
MIFENKISTLNEVIEKQLEIINKLTNKEL